MIQNADEDELVVVFAAKELSANAEAEVLRSLLQSAEIESIVRWVPLTFQNPGGIRLLVLSSDAEDARAVIEDAQRGEDCDG